MLALKLTIVPLLIAAITFAGHRWGPAVSGWLAGLPVVAGPVLFFMAIEPNLGPHLSGLLAVFPVITSVLAVFSHRYSGYECTVLLLRGLVFGLYAFAAFCLALAMLLPAWGIAPGFVGAVSCALLVQFLSRAAVQRT